MCQWDYNDISVCSGHVICVIFKEVEEEEERKLLRCKYIFILTQGGAEIKCNWNLNITTT